MIGGELVLDLVGVFLDGHGRVAMFLAWYKVLTLHTYFGVSVQVCV
jgi:hypothetical protein